MRLKNHTDIPTKLIREMIAFAKPANVTNFEVTIRNRGEGYSGHAAPRILTPSIVVSISKKKRRPQLLYRHLGGYLPMPAMTREETVLLVLAHELRHLWQGKVKRGRRVWGARGQFSERDADAYALRALRHWRRGEPMP